MNIQQAIDALIERNDLGRQDMHTVMSAIMTGAASDAQIAGFLVALRIKGETVDEITAAASVMRELSTKVSITAENLVDIVGTGGDGAKLFNVSTASSFVAAAAGCHVAKHGNRSVSSSSGSADLLEKAGVELNLSPEAVARCVEEIGLGFMFAVNHHSAMKHAITARKELATRTIFNMLGPMTNPAGVTRQLLGVYSSKLTRPIAEAMASLGSEHVMVVHSNDGLDEISIAAATKVSELKGGEISEYILNPGDFDMPTGTLDDLVVDNSDQSLELIRSAFNAGKQDSRSTTARNMIALNAGAAIYVAGVASSLQEGVAIAADCIGSGAAAQKVTELAELSKLLSSNT